MTAGRPVRFLWLLPTVVAVLGAAVILWSTLERRRVGRDLDRVFQAHVESVARLIWESTRGAAAAVDLIYAMSEASLAHAASSLKRMGDDAVAEKERLNADGVRLWLVETSPEEYVGEWGSVSPASREAFLAEVRAAAAGELVERGEVRRHGLYCASFQLKPGLVIVCKRADELARLRRETGLGPLLRKVVGRGVVYAAIQDEMGVLASSPDAELSSWEEDEVLAEVLASHPPGMTFRTIAGRHGPLFEGLGSFPLPDGTKAALRVGVDATAMLQVQAGIEWRHRLLFAVVGLLAVLSFGGFLLLGRWAKRRREAERELAAREEHSRHWQTIGQMSQTVAHEVRNPLNTLKMASQRLGREFSVPQAERAEYDELIGMLHNEADRVNNVVGEFMELGKPLVLDTQQLALAEVLSEAVTPLRIRAEQEGKRLRLDVGSQLEARLDRRRFSQVISNLVGNALDAVGEGGEVRVCADAEPECLCLLVEDDGPGMDAETLERIQKPFVTTKARGTGLGLSIARRLVEAHGGILQLSSEPGWGTRVRVLIPPRRAEEGK